MKLPNLCDPIDRYLLASGALFVLSFRLHDMEQRVVERFERAAR